MDNNTVHIALGLIFAITMITLTALEVYFIKPFSDTELLFMVIQNVGLGFANSYYAGQIQLTPSGVVEKTTSAS